ncbi:MAG: hypothetical protein V2J42_10255, partial [Wenzhouxiangella sp.]|nr:hypothetical protein [Wenzhouxiangella sp.]
GRSVDYLRGSLVVGAERWDNSSLLNFGAVFLFENEVVRRCGNFDVVFCDRFEGALTQRASLPGYGVAGSSRQRVDGLLAPRLVLGVADF